MKQTEKIVFPYETEINQLGAIQALQLDYFELPIAKQYEFVESEYESILEYFEQSDQEDLVLRKELTDLMFDVHVESFNLPSNFNHILGLLKICSLKAALQFSAFYSFPGNPLIEYLRTACTHINGHLNNKNEALLQKVLFISVKQVIIDYQTDPSIFDQHQQKLLTAFKQKNPINNSKESNSKLKSVTADKVTPINPKAISPIQIAKTIQKGDWLNFKQGSKSILIKLVWRSAEGTDFIFADRNGVKVKQINLSELILDLKSKVLELASTDSIKKSTSVLQTI